MIENNKVLTGAYCDVGSFTPAPCDEGKYTETPGAQAWIFFLRVNARGDEFISYEFAER